MKKILAATAIAAALIASYCWIMIAAGAGGSLLGIAPAHADGRSIDSTAAFLAHVHALGFVGGTGGDSDLVNAGMSTCRAVEHGSTISAMQDIAEFHLGAKGYTADEADQFVTYSISDLCPNADSVSI
jgi:hypothetical protein